LEEEVAESNNPHHAEATAVLDHSRTLPQGCPVLSPFFFAPILFGLPFHGRCICVFHFEPIGRAAGTVGRIPPLRHDTFKPHLAGVPKYGLAVAFHVFIEADAGAGLGHDRRERSLADLKRIAPQVVAIQLDQVEGVEEDAPVSVVMADEIERGNAVVIAGDSFAIDDAGTRAQACQRLNNQWEALGEVIARTAVEPHLRAVLAGNDAKAVVLDLMQPLAAGWQFIGFGWETRRDETGREGTL